ncbi:MAG: S46 family peptidase [Crocinitomicaceae bacterium]|nr:S46 family peptidase [Crocinitomicaceae bacterium]
MKKITIVLAIAISLIKFSHAEEGMLIPSVITAFESDMQAMGMKLTAEEIYSINHSSLKDAIIHFGGGCTAELVSNQGLLLTNHHCGYSQIQAHSSLEKDYLKYGFWAKNKSEELPNKGLVASRMVRIQDVTKEVLAGTNGITDKAELQKILTKNTKALITEATNGNHYKAEIKPFNQGNEFYMIVKETFLDIRLVGTPPNSIGKFGGDTDNWVWPRHTGDFSVFRIYAGTDNKPAEYNASNVPYQPVQFLKIAFNDRKVGDFTMIYGFPGETEQHVVSDYLKFIMEKERPAQIHMRELSLSVINQAMRQSDELRIKYASKQARIANAYKKWIGQIDGLRRMDAVSVKKSRELEYLQKAESNSDWKAQYGSIINDMNQLVASSITYEFEYSMLIEYFFVGPEFLKLARSVDQLRKVAETNPSGLEDAKKRLINGADDFFKDYDANVDQKIFELMTAAYNNYIQTPSTSKINNSANNYNSTTIFTKSFLTSKQRYIDFITKFSVKSLKKLQKDPGFAHFNLLFYHFIDNHYDKYEQYESNMEDLLKTYVKGKLEMFPEQKHWADANSTLRITYGKIEGSEPQDGVQYLEHTTLDGVIDKYYSGNEDFELLPRMLDLYKKKEYGRYAQDGKLWVCFTGSNHTTGGNSGSPVLDARGNLMGLNFDRTWESTMSDYMFDPSRCRNITVDIRYVLWVMDIYSGAKHLVDEMVLVTN